MEVRKMEIEDWKSVGSLAPLVRELRQLGLESNIVELEVAGFTVVPPEKVGPPEFCEGVREALERTMLRRYGADGLSPKRWANVNDIQRFMLWEDPIFEQLTYNPAGLGLAEYLLGTDCVLSLCAAWVKGPGEIRTGIHGDYLDPALVAQPEQMQNCNMHFMLTDYTVDDGCISFVPGSHKWRRQVTPSDAKLLGRSRHTRASASWLDGDLGQPHLARLLPEENAGLAHDLAVRIHAPSPADGGSLPRHRHPRSLG